MINRVKIENVATYTNPVDVTLKDINFIYGGNGTGKTTFTKIISGELISPLCVVENPTANNERLLVYNKSFVDENFREVGDISGIFTLGRDAGELIEYIKQKEAEHAQYNATAEQRKEQIKKIEDECKAIDLAFQNQIWSTQLKYGAIFPQAMTGTRGSKQAFKKKCLEVFVHFDPKTVKPQEEIESLYRAAFAKELPTYTLYNVLFIVSSLVKSIIQFCRNGEQAVKQVIVSTHNIYFHKEITFVGGRDHWPETRTGFYIIRKKDNISSITQYSENQIQSSYEMLWSDIRNPANGSAKTVFNTMRRILENYFNIIGGIDYEACVNQFEGEDKVICKSLISCINEQSHTISDDYFMCVEDSEIEQYLRIFSEIFEKMGHISHYNMMMHIEN